MTRMISSRLRHRSSRWAIAAITGVLLSASGAFIAAPSAMAAGPPAASASAVAMGLGVASARAEIVILVDTSYSLSSGQNGLYPKIQTELPAFLRVLARQAPQDAVEIFEYSKTVEPLYSGPPQPNVRLPANATGAGADVGAALALAINTLANPPAGVRAGGVLLLSDGQIYAPDDPLYGSFGAPGWSALRARVHSLPVPVTGYGLLLTTNETLINAEKATLGAVFGTHVTIAANGPDLAGGLQTFTQDLLNSEVAAAAAADSGKGVQVSWSGLPGTDGREPLDLRSAGHMDVKVTLTATTRRVPLYVTGLSVKSSGLSAAVSGSLPADVVLVPGESVTLPVRLTWQPTAFGVSLTGTPRTVEGQLVLAGQVASPYTQAIRSSFNDTSFSTGSLTGASSPQFLATTPAASSFILIIILVVAALMLLSLVILYRFHLRLRGTLTLFSVDGNIGEIPLSRLRWSGSVETRGLIGIPGRMMVYGHLFDSGMRITLRLQNRPSGRADLEPFGRTMVTGIEITHSARPRVRPAYSPSANRK
jgi:hypothetical protein